ncbi:transcriptional regulator [Enterobacter sp. CC120223-11]|uniref:winged helix-turn-helix domain-containing protein n=1 Tax=Enterobacter sp. CC120223-11 TaxID=1378073 RepID=UPI000BD7744A|nr:transcriptional regulator [Enterobacter sp. CC120223-11]SNY67978.1 DNA-binding winged helix-turn-helix (wHTH) domain-containing protein [Enterobacter sp. CC120223-11]
MNKRYGSVNNWLIDIPSGSILHLVSGERKRLGEYQLKLLHILMQEAGRILTREELTNLVWERRVIGNNSLPNAIHALRTALEDDGKTQKIIRTIPRKGYLLEAEYCCFVEKEEAEVSDPEADDASLAHEPTEGLTPEAQDEPEGIEPQIKDVAPEPTPSDSVRVMSRAQRWVTLALLLMLSSFLSMILASRLTMHHPGNTLTAEEIQANVYSHIKLYAIDNEVNPTWEEDQLYGKLKGTLYTLNQMIKSQGVTMDIYFFSDNQTLNYTFSLRSHCDEKQLVMTLYHWRIDAQNLNNLILRETRRKLSEMATCKDS